MREKLTPVELAGLLLWAIATGVAFGFWQQSFFAGMWMMLCVIILVCTFDK